MAEFTNTKEKRLGKLLEVSRLLLATGNAQSFYHHNKEFIPTVIPSDFIALFDLLIQEGCSMEALKTCSNKLFNIFHKPIDSFIRIEPETGSFLWVMEKNNMEMESVLKEIRPVFRDFNTKASDKKNKKNLIALFEKLEKFVSYYTIKENVLFSVIEKAWPDYRCLQLMWSFHDDIRRNIKFVLNTLQSQNIDLKEFNRCVGDIFFNMLAIKFREEKILFPHILATISIELLQAMNREGHELGYPYFRLSEMDTNKPRPSINEGLTDLGTGNLTVEQIKLIFNNLPVDITFVDENNKVCYFSTPQKRIFPRTNAILGREVNNCHPPESVHVVEKIVTSFKNGEKDKADFRIKIHGAYVLIQYFAVRDENGKYKGVLEVSQEISEIRTLEGEKRLLDW